MAGDWIKIDITTPDKPEIDKMASLLKLDHDSIVGKCVRVWIWADLQSVDGNALIVTESFLDRLTYCPGFASALRQVGWLSGREGRLTIPNFDRHNGQTAKNRALTGKRVQKSRNGASVTKSLPEIEKRREEKSNTETQCADAQVVSVSAKPDAAAVNAPAKRASFSRPSVQEIIDYVLEIRAAVDAKVFWDYYESNGWKVGRNAMKDWRATVRQWQARNNQGSNNGANQQGRLTAAEQREAINASGFDRIRRAAALASGNNGGGISPGTGTTLFIEEHRDTDAACV